MHEFYILHAVLKKNGTCICMLSMVGYTYCIYMQGLVFVRMGLTCFSIRTQ